VDSLEDQDEEGNEDRPALNRTCWTGGGTSHAAPVERELVERQRGGGGGGKISRLGEHHVNMDRELYREREHGTSKVGNKFETDEV